jgi:hypothetical protein
MKQERQIKKSSKIILAVLVVGLGIVLGGVLLVRNLSLFPKSRLLFWEDTTSGAEIWLQDPWSFDLTLELHVRRNGTHRKEYVIDKSEYGRLSFVLYGDRLLVLNNQYIFAAYDIPTDCVIHYDDLPFTLYEGQGKVVDSTRIGDRASMRSGFPLKRESDQEYRK